MEFALTMWGDGIPRLSHWDRLHGNDVVLALNDGKAYRCYYDEDEVSQREEINLVTFLCSLIKKSNEVQNENEIRRH